MKMKFRLVGGLMLAAVATVMFGSCTSDSDSAGLEYMPDMYRSPAIEPYVDYGELRGRENVDVKMTQSAMTPPKGAIPYFGTNKEEVALMLPWPILPSKEFKVTHGLTGFEFTAEDTYNTSALAWTTNPLPLMGEDGKETFAKGKELYTANCMHCHGEKGDGKGQMMVNGTYVGVPSYADKVALSEGQMFYSIYYGKGMMGSHASQVSKKDIWTLIHYIRKFQNADYGKSGAAMPADTATVQVAEMPK